MSAERKRGRSSIEDQPTPRAKRVPGGRGVIARRELALLCTAGAMAATGYTMIGLLTPLVALRFGAGPAAVGALVSAGFLLPLVMAVPAGTWADRWGARRMVRVGFLAFAVAALPMAAWPSWTTLIFGFVLANLAHLIYVVGSQALVADSRSRSRPRVGLRLVDDVGRRRAGRGPAGRRVRPRPLRRPGPVSPPWPWSWGWRWR